MHNKTKINQQQETQHHTGSAQDSTTAISRKHKKYIAQTRRHYLDRSGIVKTQCRGDGQSIVKWIPHTRDPFPAQAGAHSVGKDVNKSLDA